MNLITLNAQMNMYLCYHYVLLLPLLLLLCYLNFWREIQIYESEKFQILAGNLNSKCKMQNANGKCNRLSVKPFIATALFSLFIYMSYVLCVTNLVPFSVQTYWSQYLYSILLKNRSWMSNNTDHSLENETTVTWRILSYV